MAKAKSVTRKKKGRPAAAWHPVKTLRMPADLVARIDLWAKRNGTDSHSEAMRHLLELGLRAPKRKSATEGSNPNAGRGTDDEGNSQCDGANHRPKLDASGTVKLPQHCGTAVFG